MWGGGGVLTSMYPHMTKSVRGGAEGLGAVVALVLALARVYAAVHVQRVAARELLAAELALVLFLEIGDGNVSRLGDLM